jgi:glycosyltransferase involved in cell wall biosynthesis
MADDGSDEDTTQRYLRSIVGPKLRIVWLAHSGNPSAARNAAVAASAGRHLAFLDSDDVWMPAKLDKQMTVCDGELIPKRRLRATPAPEGWIFEQLLTLEIGIAMPTVVTARNLFDRAGGFDERQRFGEFHDLCLRLALQGEVAVVREPLCAVRRHDEHYSSKRIANQAGWLQLYEKMAAIVTPRRHRPIA